MQQITRKKSTNYCNCRSWRKAAGWICSAMTSINQRLQCFRFLPCIINLNITYHNFAVYSATGIAQPAYRQSSGVWRKDEARQCIRNRQTDRQTDRHTDKQTDWVLYISDAMTIQLVACGYWAIFHQLSGTFSLVMSSDGFSHYVLVNASM